jgi:hypothetical protein
MKKIIIPALLFLLVLSLPAAAGVAVEVKIPLPRLVINTPPVLVVIPGTYVYAAPDIEADLIFYQGFWYRPYGGHWYRSDDYNGRWVAVSAQAVPVPLTRLPPDWKRVPPGHERMPYGHVKKNWQGWEREKHWERRGSGRAVGVGVEGRSAPARGERYEERRDDRGKKDKKGKKGRDRNGDDDDDDRYEDRGRRR